VGRAHNWVMRTYGDGYICNYCHEKAAPSANMGDSPCHMEQSMPVSWLPRLPAAFINPDVEYSFTEYSYVMRQVEAGRGTL